MADSILAAGRLLDDEVRWFVVMWWLVCDGCEAVGLRREMPTGRLLG